MKYLITLEQLRVLEHGADLYERDLESTHFRLVEVDGTNEQYAIVRKEREALARALSALRLAFSAQYDGDPEKTGWVLKPRE
jgi:hypothetical protein